MKVHEERFVGVVKFFIESCHFCLSTKQKVCTIKLLKEKTYTFSQTQGCDLV